MILSFFMVKFKYLALIVLIIVATLFDFFGNDGTVESIEPVSKICVTLAGDSSQALCFDHPPTIGEVLSLARLRNIYNFDLTTVLNSHHCLYLGSAPDLVSLNNASQEQLVLIKGIGPVTAQKIIDYRKTQPFTTIEQIMEVSGIGEKTYLKLREFLCL